MKKEINFFRNIFVEKPESLIFFVTTKCNFRCKSCFYWKSLGKGDISDEEIKKVISNFPAGIKNVSLSGGEPFLRENLSSIIKLLKERGVISIGIPTNASIKNIPEIVSILLQENPEIEFLIIISLDGLEKTNDAIRMPRSFKKALSCLKKLIEMKKNYKNLKVQVASTITNLNYKEIKEFADFIKKFDVDIHTFDWIRGSHQGILKLPPAKEIKKIDAIRIKTANFYNRKKSFLHRFYSNKKIKKIIKTQERVLAGKKWDYPCLAGKIELVVEANGDLKICEFLPPIGNLKEKSYYELINSEKAKKMFNSIKNHKCDCTHICFVSSSLDHSPKAILKMLLG